MMKLKCIMDNEEFKQKPTDFEFGMITNRMKIDNVKEYSIEEIKEAVLKGITIRPSHCGKTEDTWKSQRLFMVDIDNKPKKPHGSTKEEYDIICEEYLKTNHRTYQQVIDHCIDKGITPTFVYTSFNHQEHWHKMRVCFLMNETIFDKDTAKTILRILMGIVGEVDEQCTNLNRFFFAGYKIVFESDNIIDKDNILAQSDILKCKQPKQILPKKPNDNTHSIHINKVKSEDINMNVDNLHIDAIKRLDSNILKSLMNSGLEQDKGLAVGKKGIVSLSFSFSSPNPKTQQIKDEEGIIIVNNKMELYEYINNINLYDFLGLNYNNMINNKFICILDDHDDNKPSSSIYTTDNGTQIYKCFGCGFVAGILKLVEKLADCNKVDAINFIKAVYNIELKTSDWQQKQMDTYDANIEYLVSDLLAIEYPKLHKYIKNKIPQLIQMNVLAKHFLQDEDQSVNDKSIFFISMGKLMSKFNTNSIDSVVKTINLFCILDMLKKLPEDQIPKEMLNKARHIAALANQPKIRNHYQLPEYKESILKNSEIQAQILQDNNFLMKGLSREWVIRTFDIATANEIYPLYQFENERGTTAESDDRTDVLIEAIRKSIKSKGYAIESEIIKKLSKLYDKHVIDLQFKRSRQQIIETLNLVRVQTTKVIKEQYKIKASGYPQIWIVNQPLENKEDC